jgi:outer membrane protein assembly factor BamB
VVASQTNGVLHPIQSSGSGAVPSTAAQGPDGNVYFSNGGALRAVDPASGASVWSVAGTGGRGVSAPAVGPDGTIHVSQSAFNKTALVVALAPDGTQRWAFATPEIVAYFSDLAVDAAGGVFGRYLETQFTRWHAFALDASGNLLWKTTQPYASEFSPTAPALLPGGDVVFTAVDDAWDDRLIRLDADTGTIVWSVVPGTSLSGAVIADNGLVLVHSPGSPPACGVRAFDPADGSLVWSVPYFATEYGEDNPPVLLPGGEIVAIANGDALGNRRIYRISPDGVLLTTVAYPSTGYYTDSIAGGDGTLYVWTNMRLMAFSPLDGTVKFQYAAAPTAGCLRTSQPTILADGSIFATWQRNQTCNSPSPFGQFVTLAPPP